MRTTLRRVRARLTWRAARWWLRVTVQSWVIQGAIMGALAVSGVSLVAAAVSAKAAAYVVFAGQCVRAARAG